MLFKGEMEIRGTSVGAILLLLKSKVKTLPDLDS